MPIYVTFRETTVLQASSRQSAQEFIALHLPQFQTSMGIVEVHKPLPWRTKAKARKENGQ